MKPLRSIAARRPARRLGLTLGVFSAIFGLFTLMDHPAAFVGTLFASQARAATAPTATPDAETSGTEPVRKDGADSETLAVFQLDPLAKLADSLQAKELQLKDREAKVNGAEKRLDALRKETEQNLSRIEARLREMQAIAAKADLQNKKELSQWVDIYQAMAPKDAGKVIQGLDPELAKSILSQMEPKKAGKILGFVAPEKASEWSRRLAKHP